MANADADGDTVKDAVAVVVADVDVVALEVLPPLLLPAPWLSALSLPEVLSELELEPSLEPSLELELELCVLLQPARKGSDASLGQGTPCGCAAPGTAHV